MNESKVRPVVVVSNGEYNKSREDIVVCAITSKVEQKQYGIAIDNENLSDGRLPLKSMIRADKIMSIEKSLVIKAFARLDNRAFDALVEEIIKLVKRGK